MTARAIGTAVRITPAYAGKSVNGQPAHRQGEDHPCVCGEKVTERRVWMDRAGSPLRMRGKASRNDAEALDVRITPAYAGKRSSRRCRSRRGKDHPCVCGEKDWHDDGRVD